MDAQELRSIQEAYLEVYEGYKNLPRFKMLKKAASKKLQAASIVNKARQSGESDETIGGQIANKKVEKKLNQSNTMLDKAIAHDAENSKRKSEANKIIGQVAKENPAAARSLRKMRREEVDLYDIILSHLLDEGYAETPEAAEKIMVNMSEEWRDSIIG
jgi:hypothetical protein